MLILPPAALPASKKAKLNLLQDISDGLGRMEAQGKEQLRLMRELQDSTDKGKHQVRAPWKVQANYVNWQ